MLHRKNKISTGALHVENAFSHRCRGEEELFQTGEAKEVFQEWESEIVREPHGSPLLESLSTHQAILHTCFT